LRRGDGYQVKLTNTIKNIAELGPIVIQNVTRELVPRALYALQAGQTLVFTPFSVNQQGISNGREFIPWSQVQAIDIKQGRVMVKKSGMFRNWGAAMVAKIPNCFVFITVSQEMIRQSR
jgi:hypothetical protein